MSDMVILRHAFGNELKNKSRGITVSVIMTNFKFFLIFNIRKDINGEKQNCTKKLILVLEMAT